MTEVEARLRGALREVLEPVTADRGRAEKTLRRARRARALRGVAAGLAGVLLAGAAATAWERREDSPPPPPPAAEPEQAATFALDFDPGSGTVTVDVPKAQVCFDLSRDAASMGAQLRYDVPGPADVGVVATTGPPRPAMPQCRPVDPDQAERVLRDPEGHYVQLAPGYLTRSAFLEPLPLAPEDAPDVAEIVCSQDGAVVLTPQVQPRRDGVRFRVHNQGGAWRWVNFTTPEGGNWGGRLPRREVLDNRGNIAPGSHLVGCFRDDDSIPYSDPADPDYASFTVVDPYELWIDYELDCPEDRSLRKIVTDEPKDALLPADVEAMIREHVPGIEADDAIVRATYPESEAKIENRTVVRDGRNVATLYLLSAEDPDVEGRYWWAIGPKVCPGWGIGE